MTKQTRRSISVRGTTYQRLRAYSENQDRSMSDIVEDLLAKLFMARKEGRPAPTPARSVVPQRVSAPKNDYRNISF